MLWFTYCCYTFLCAVLGRFGAFGGFSTHTLPLLFRVDMQVDAGQWEEWSRLLSRSPAAPLNAASSRPSEALGQLYSLAVELRDKLRYR